MFIHLLENNMLVTLLYLYEPGSNNWQDFFVPLCRYVFNNRSWLLLNTYEQHKIFEVCKSSLSCTIRPNRNPSWSWKTKRQIATKCYNNSLQKTYCHILNLQNTNEGKIQLFFFFFILIFGAFNFKDSFYFICCVPFFFMPVSVLRWKIYWLLTQNFARLLTKWSVCRFSLLTWIGKSKLIKATYFSVVNNLSY